MSPVATPAVSQPSFIKMEDRKRSAAQDDFAPPTKRQAVNGSKGSTDSDLPWAKDLEVSQSHDSQASPSSLAIFYPNFVLIPIYTGGWNCLQLRILLRDIYGWC